MMRSGAVHIAGKLSYRDVIVRLWRRDPSLTVAEVKRRTNAPWATVSRVRRDLVAAGVLRRGPEFAYAS